MPVTFEDLKKLYFGVTNPDQWQRVADQFHVAGNAYSNFKNNIAGPTGGSPIGDPSMSFSDVWHKMMDATNTPGKGATQPSNQSGRR